MPEIQTLYEDEQILAVNKPAGMPTVPMRQGGTAIRDVLGSPRQGEPTLRLVHRLDMQTSGVLILVKTVDAQRHLSNQFKNRQVEKNYLALVRGHPDAESGIIVAPLAEHAKKLGRMVIARKGGLDAETHWRLIKQWSGIALLRCRPRTGRQHQIRVHLAHAGMPLLVDELYGGAESFLLSSVKGDYRPSTRHGERPLIARLTLHAESITFQHPTRGQPLRVEAPLPKDFQATLTQLRKLNP